MKCVTSVSVTPSSLTIREGQWSNAVKAEVCPEDAECRSVKWYSDNTAVATVNTSSGQIYGRARARRASTPPRRTEAEKRTTAR